MTEADTTLDTAAREKKVRDLYKALKSCMADIQELVLARARYRRAAKAFRQHENKPKHRIIGKFLSKPKRHGKNSGKGTMGVQKSWIEREHEERTGEPIIMS